MTNKPILPICPNCGRSGTMVELTWVLMEYPIVEIDPETGEAVDYDAGKLTEETYGESKYYCTGCTMEFERHQFLKGNKIK